MLHAHARQGVQALAFVVVAASQVAPAQAQRIDTGEIVVGQGVNGATLGMTRGQVIDELGTPAEENAQGVMSYQRLDHQGTGIFDISDVEERQGQPLHPVLPEEW